MPRIMNSSDIHRATRDELRTYLKMHGINTRAKDVLSKLQGYALTVYGTEIEINAPARRAHRYAVRHARGSYTSPIPYSLHEPMDDGSWSRPAPVHNLARGVPWQRLDVLTLPTVEKLYRMTIPELQQTGNNLHAVLANPLRRSTKRDEMLLTISIIYAHRMSNPDTDPVVH